ncbi:MAG: toprim domain-containing protein [Thermoplasmata archaeon]|nr:toprim domain-containing protein [Thermoplasmata archaeon]
MLKEEKIIEFVDSLIDENRNIPVIVEGKRDELALRKLGLKGKVIIFNSGSSLIEFCEKLERNYRKVILFLDWDEKGNELTNSIEKILSSEGVHCDLNYRKILYSLVGKSIRSVEEIYPLYLLSIEKVQSNFSKNFSKRTKR